MDKIVYTIIIPHYNIPFLLVRCLRSIPERDDIQIIVVDDNSPGCEKYKENISELSRRNLEFYVTTDKKGAGHVRNVALPYIKGEKVIFADSDDLFTDEFSSCLDEFKADDTDLIFFNTIGAFSDDLCRTSNRNKDKLFDEYAKTGNIDIFRYRYTEPWGKIYSAKLIKEKGITFDETIVANDQMFSVKAGVYAKTIKVINRPFYIVTVREGSISYKKLDTKDKLLARFYVQARVQVFLQSHGYCEDKMMIFGHAVNMCRRYPLTFIKKLPWLSSIGINVWTLLWLIIRDRLFSPSLRMHKNISEKSYTENKLL